ncbi:MAG: hypothetical protein KKH66_09050, partial [Proteobacteria bacterium]|nr:hypothetical protein [Pseudomonadota bacterium]
LRNPFVACRYHSLVVPEASVSAPLLISAYTMEGEVMGLRHRDLPVEGVQFHPESIATAQGMTLFQNFLRQHLGGTQANGHHRNPADQAAPVQV